MKFIEVENRALKLSHEGHEVKFYEMVLCWAAEELWVDGLEEELLTEEQLKELVSCMADYLADDFHESPWHVADALINLVKEHGAEKVISDCDNGGELLEKELEKM